MLSEAFFKDFQYFSGSNISIMELSGILPTIYGKAPAAITFPSGSITNPALPMRQPLTNWNPGGRIELSRYKSLSSSISPSCLYTKMSLHLFYADWCIPGSLLKKLFILQGSIISISSVCRTYWDKPVKFKCIEFFPAASLYNV
jgi:hypothetical protein